MAISKIRTAEELKNSDLNYFIAFDIAPTETNTKKITDALIAKRNTFALQRQSDYREIKRA